MSEDFIKKLEEREKQIQEIIRVFDEITTNIPQKTIEALITLIRISESFRKLLAGMFVMLKELGVKNENLEGLALDYYSLKLMQEMLSTLLKNKLK